MNKLLGKNTSKLYPTHRNAQSFRIVTHFIYKRYFYITDLVKNESYLPLGPVNSTRYTIYGEVQIYIYCLFWVVGNIYQMKTSSYK